MMIAKFLQSTFTASSAQKQEVEGSSKQKELLPGNLAGQILNLEIECQGEHISKQLLGELVSLYTKAIQYYESISSEKYKIYKKRIQSFLAKPSIQSMLVGKDSNLTLKKEMVERNKLHATVSTKEEMNKIIQRSDKRADSNKKILDKEIKTQQLNLEARIQRRKSMSNKSTKIIAQDSEVNWKTNILKNQKTGFNFLLNDVKDKNIKKVFF